MTAQPPQTATTEAVPEGVPGAVPGAAPRPARTTRASALRRPPVIDLADRRAVAAWRPAAPETVAEAERLKDAALLDFGLAESAVASWIFSKCPYQIPTTAVPTAAVAASGDGSCLLLFNPDFFVRLGLDGVKFVLFHEARHLVHRHLFVDPHLRDDPVFDLAAEVTINHVAMVRLGRGELPRLDGVPTGVDPREVYAAYAADLAGQGLDPLDHPAFVATDMTAYTELKRMKRPLAVSWSAARRPRRPCSMPCWRRGAATAARGTRSATCSGVPRAPRRRTGSGAGSARTSCAAGPRRPGGSPGGSAGSWTSWPPGWPRASGWSTRRSAARSSRRSAAIRCWRGAGRSPRSWS
jgi:hypothetical protein